MRVVDNFIINDHSSADGSCLWMTHSPSPHPWHTQVPTPNNIVPLHIRHHPESIFRQHWLDEINNSIKNCKLRLYKEIKYTFMPEPYLFFKIPKFRHAISRLRLCSHHLEIETGRYAGPLTPANQRFCAACLGKVGDEYHFLTECVSIEYEYEYKKFIW